MNTKNIWLFLLLSSLVAGCSSAGKQATVTPEIVPTAVSSSSIISEGRLEPVRYAEIAFTASGVVSDVLVEEGQAVKKGQPIIQLGGETDVNYAAAQLELANVQKALNDLKNSAGTDLAQAVIDLNDAKQEYKDAVDYLDDLQTYDKFLQTQKRSVLVNTWKGPVYEVRTKNIKGPAPEEWIVDAKNDMSLKKARLDAAQKTYDRLKDGVDSEQLPVLEARLTVAQAKIASLSVLAPFDGVVADLNAKTGSSINAGQTAVTVADFSQWLVKTTDLTEIDVVNLKEGQPVTITLDAFPGKELNGEILSIGQTYAENQGDIVYEVTVLLNDVDPGMRWGMTAAVKFQNQD